MDARDPTRAAKTWRDRLAGRVVFNLSTAEAAVRQAYRAGGLPEPRQVLWVSGPRDAAQAITFIESPPRRSRLKALAVLVVGAAAWVGLAFATDNSAFAVQPPATAAMWSAVFAGLSLVLAGGRRLPIPPGPSSRQYDAKTILLGAISFIAMAGYMFALRRLGGLPTDPVGRDAVLALAAAVGTFPGVFFLWRVRHTYGYLPRSLRELAPTRSVARELERARWKFWALPRRTAIGPRSEESLLQAYRSAYRDAFAQQRSHVLARTSPTVSWNGSRWMAADALGNLYPETVASVPPHLDGIEDATRAVAAARIDATGAAASFADLAFYVDRLYPFAAIAVAVQPATTVALDAEGRPHAEDGPALAWADGTRIFAWHGRLVQSDLIDRDRPVTRSRIDRKPNPDRRWVLIERYGLGRYLLEAGATEIQRDECGALYRLVQRLSEPILAVRVVNHTPEPDGNLREFWLSVPPTMTTARQAVAWTFGLAAEEYDPVAQS